LDSRICRVYAIDLLYNLASRLGLGKRPDFRVDETLLGVEIGVDRGWLSEYLLHNLPALNLMMVDPMMPFDPSSRYHQGGDSRSRRDDRKWNRVRAEVRNRISFAGSRAKQIFQFSADAAGEVADGVCDFVFIDGDHTYGGVCEDIAMWKPKVRPGGVLCGHDYGNPRCPDVERAVNDSLGKANLDVGMGYTWYWRGATIYSEAA